MTILTLPLVGIRVLTSSGSAIYPMRCLGWLNPQAKVASDMGYPGDRYVPFAASQAAVFSVSYVESRRPDSIFQGRKCAHYAAIRH